MKSDKYGERRGAAFGLAGVVKGFGISSLKKYEIINVLREGLVDRLVISNRSYFLRTSVDHPDCKSLFGDCRNSAKRREGALLAFECLCEKLGRLFEP